MILERSLYNPIRTTPRIGAAALQFRSNHRLRLWLHFGHQLSQAVFFSWTPLGSPPHCVAYRFVRVAHAAEALGWPYTQFHLGMHQPEYSRGLGQ